MPGFLYHLACANRVTSMLQANLQQCCQDAFFVGNLIPDLVTNKSASHFRIHSQNGWAIPDLDRALEVVSSRLDDPYYAGIYCHLVLDYVFITEVLDVRYTLLDGTVISRNGQTWPVTKFLSRESGIYADYSSYNTKLIDDNVISVDKFLAMDSLLPENILNNLGWQQNGCDWQEKLRGYLKYAEKRRQHLFEFGEILAAIRKASDIFICTYSKFVSS